MKRTGIRNPPHRDENEPEIIEALEHFGCTVNQLDSRKKGTPDLLVLAPPRLFFRCFFVVEIKNPKRDGKRKELSPDQLIWFEKNAGGPVFCVLTVEQALAAFDAVMSNDIGKSFEKYQKEKGVKND